MPVQIYNAYVLHRIPYRETSYLVDIFTSEQGKLRGVAKGVRGSKNDRKSLLQAFQLLDVSVSGRNDLKNIGRIEAKQSSFNFPDRNMYCALYLNELVNRVLPEGLPVEDIFECYQSSLQKLSQLNMKDLSALAQIESLLREFEINLLSNLGYMPDLSQCNQTGEGIEAEGHYEYHQELGLQRVAIPRQQTVFIGKDLIAMSEFDWTAMSLKTAKQIMRLALKPLVGDKPLKSRELFSGVR